MFLIFMKQTLEYSTCLSYLTHARAFWKDIGFPIPPSIAFPTFASLTRDFKARAEARVQQRNPINPATISRICRTVDPSDYFNNLILLLIHTLFLGFFCLGELTVPCKCHVDRARLIRRSHVVITDSDNFRLFLPGSKNDRFNLGVWVNIPGGDPLLRTSPISLLRHHLASIPSPPTTPFLSTSQVTP